MTFRNACRAALCAAAILALSGCETMNETMADMKQSWNSINWPSFSAAGSAGETDDSLPPGEMAERINLMDDGSVSTENAECPKIEVVHELSMVHQFIEEPSTAPEDRMSSIEIKNVRNKCKTNGNNVIVDLDIDFEGHLGPQARAWNTDKPSFAYPYFIAVTTPEGNINAKEIFALTVSYDKGEESITQTEHLRQLIPADGAVYGNAHALLLGFQLTDRELSYNRALLGLKDPYAVADTRPQEKKKPVKKKAPPKPAKAPEKPAESAVPAPVPVSEPVASVPAGPAPVAAPTAPAAPAAPEAAPTATPPGIVENSGAASTGPAAMETPALPDPLQLAPAPDMPASPPAELPVELSPPPAP
ncbi:MAG: hypothetical protein HY370_00525 [Proteobacteria bacterium]|nr:hypothetical protein [Pseudomonadota bacterium]